LTVAAGANVTHRQSLCGTLCCPGIDRILARTIGTQCLLHEHRQYLRRRIQPFTMLWKVLLGLPEQFRTGEHIEEIHCRMLLGMLGDLLATLLRLQLGSTIHVGWFLYR
jgi:hypothetical protein